LRDKLLRAYAGKNKMSASEDEAACLVPQGVDALAQVDWDEILTSPESYIRFLQERFYEVDPELEAEAYTYVMDPPKLQSLVVAHLRQMWDQYLKAEWDRVRPMLEASIRAFRQLDLSNLTKLEAASLISGHNLEEDWWVEKVGQAEQIIFVPNAHVGPYLGSFMSGSAVGIIYGARLPKGAQVDFPELSRAEIIVRLSALADDARLRILKYIADQGEQRSQDIMQHLDLSQSAASRHLTQLSATGYLKERRCDGAKCYAINPERIDETLQAITTFLLGSSPAPAGNFDRSKDQLLERVKNM
jgi:DNA-binding transcriptional ArsR family regulator